MDDPKEGTRILPHTSFHHFIYSKKRLGLKENLTFNQGTRTRFWALKGYVGVRGGGRGFCIPLEKSWVRPWT